MRESPTYDARGYRRIPCAFSFCTLAIATHRLVFTSVVGITGIVAAVAELGLLVWWVADAADTILLFSARHLKQPSGIRCCGVVCEYRGSIGEAEDTACEEGATREWYVTGH